MTKQSRIITQAIEKFFGEKRGWDWDNSISDGNWRVITERGEKLEISRFGEACLIVKMEKIIPLL